MPSSRRPFLSLQDCLLDLGHVTSFGLRTAYGANLSFGEETITELNLLGLHRRQPMRVVIKAFNKHTEPLTGADWEWVFVDSRRRRSFSARVQAKRLRKDSNRFPDILTRQAKTAPKPQIDALIDDAVAGRMVPLYCIYVDSTRLDDAFGVTFANGFAPRNLGSQAEYGCWLAHASDIRASRSNRLEDYQRHLWPWHLIATNPEPTAGTRSSLPDTIRANIALRANGENGTARMTNATAPYVPPVAESVPAYAMAALEGADMTDFGPTFLRRGLRGLVVLQGPDSEDQRRF